MLVEWLVVNSCLALQLIERFSFQAPPPYTPPTNGWYAAPPPAYTPGPGSYGWLPQNSNFGPAPTNGVFVRFVPLPIFYCY